ncbi:MAG: endonuclease NucS [Candidatus Staskawiczbacteria bacterium]|nr:endonuclease NucS [Candidatus Staskawiczbacteria bacterium]
MINQEKIQEWVKIFLKHVSDIGVEEHVKNQEGYKFKAVDTFMRNFNIEADDLVSMLESSIVNNNLVAGSWYFPRKMLLIFATENPDETRQILRNLFDDNKKVSKRINETKKSFDELMLLRNKRLGESSHSFIGIRFLSLLLSYRYPMLHNALKPREWNIFCKFLDNDFSIPGHTSDGERYEAYLPKIEDMREYLKQNNEISAIKDALTSGLTFQDDEFRWITQDVIYVVAQIMQKEDVVGVDVEAIDSDTTAPEGVDDSGEKESLTTGERFTYEEDLQNFIFENMGKISLGGELELYNDSDGRSGQYYNIKDVGTIDILAIDKEGNFVVIELKRNSAADAVAGQLGRYMQWVEGNLAQKMGKTVRGIIIAHSAKNSLSLSAKALRFPVSIMLYKLKIEMTEL